jgi:hypothetical protein
MVDRPGRAVRRTADGVDVRVRVTPGAATDEVEGTVDRPDGVSLAVRVRAAPHEGAANAAAIRLLARWFDVRPSRIRLVTGDSARLKTVRIVGDPTTLLATAEDRLGAPHASSATPSQEPKKRERKP